jgi:hypothetical protein
MDLRVAGQRDESRSKNDDVQYSNSIDFFDPVHGRSPVFSHCERGRDEKANGLETSLASYMGNAYPSTGDVSG